MRAVMFVGIAVTFVLGTAVASPRSASALTKQEIKCGEKIGDDAEAFLEAKLRAITDCNGAIVSKGTCNTGRRDQKIANATAKLGRKLASDCRNVTLENLGFPASCPDPDGGSFTTDNLAACLTPALETAVDDITGLAQPDVTEGTEPKCQRTIGRTARGFFIFKFGARVRCFSAQLRGKLSSNVNCLAEVPPGTGDKTTDKLIRKAQGLITAGRTIQKDCKKTDLSTLGFPGSCPDNTGGSFSVSDLQACLLSQGEAGVDQLIALVFAQGAPGATPTVTPVETPTAVATATGAPGATATTTAAGTPGPTSTAAATTTAGATSTAVSTPASTATGETPAPTATPAATTTEIIGPTSTSQATPSPGETPAETATAGGPTPEPTSTAGGGACPTQVSFEANGDTTDLDTGWTGQSHDNHVINNGLLTVNVTGCAGTVASVTGPAPNAGGTASNNHRCTGDSSVQCTSDADCTGIGTCTFFFGAPLPLSSGGVSVCVVNQVTGTVTGTVDVTSGDSVNEAPLISRVFTGPTLANPCPTCGTGGFGTTSNCAAGPNAGKACTVNGTSPLFGSTSFDCPPDPAANIAALNITLHLTTGLQTLTLSASNPLCTGPGFTTLNCFCDTCGDSSGKACMTNADCNGSVCGGKRCLSGTNAGAACTAASECPPSNACGRPGNVTKPNDCSDATCSPNPSDTDSVNEGQCEGGPFEQFCNIERFRGCSSNADCTKTGDACTFGKFRECYTDNGVLGNSLQVQGNAVPFSGSPATSSGTLGAFFCVSPTTSGSVNAVAGLPGLGRLTLPGTATLIP